VTPRLDPKCAASASYSTGRRIVVADDDLKFEMPARGWATVKAK
jgi:hypothetical protein